MKKVILFVILVMSYFPVALTEEISEQDVYIDTAYFRKASQFDNGSLHVFVANKSGEIVTLTEIHVNNIPVDRLDDETFLWYQVVPPDIMPGHVSEVIIKFFKVPNKEKPIEIKITTMDGKILKGKINPIPNPLIITYVAFSSGLTNIYLYLENDTLSELTVRDVYLHTEVVTGLSYIPEKKIQPGRRVPVIIHLLAPLTKGEYVTVKVTTENGPAYQNTVRVFSHFPITFEDGSVTPDTGLDTEGFRIIEDIVCPMHAHGSLKSAARKIAGVIQRARQTYPTLPSCIGICRYDKEWAYFMFGQMPDCIKINPNQVSTSFREITHVKNLSGADSPGLKHMHISRWLTELARKGSYPRAVYTSPVVTKNSPYYEERYPTAEELRLMTYYEITGGTKGIMFRSGGWQEMLNVDKRLADEFCAINVELQMLKKFLKIGEPVKLAETDNPLVEANTILAANEAIALILINQDVKIDYTSTNKTPFAYNPQYKFNVKINVPEWMEIEYVYHVGGISSKLDYSYKDNVITIPISRLDITAQIVLTAAQKN